MRRFLVVVLVIGVALAVLPGAVGAIAANQLQQALASGAVPGELISFERRWFASHGQLMAQLRGPGDVPVSLPIDFSYRHGPLSWQGRPRFALLVGNASIAATPLPDAWQLQRTEPLWQAQFSVSYLANTHFTDRAQSFVYADQLAFDQWRGAGTLGARGGIDYHAELAGLRVIGAGGPLLISGLDMQFKRPSAAADVSDLELQFNLAGYEVGGAGDALRGEGISAHLQVQPAPGSPTGRAVVMKYEAASTALAGEVYRDGVLEFDLAPVPPAFVAELGTAAKAAYLGRPWTEIMTALLAAARLQLLPAGPSLELRQLAFTAPAGAFHLNGGAALPVQSAAPGNWLAVLPDLALDLTAKAAKPLAVQWLAARSALDQQQALFESGRAIDPAAVTAQAEARAQQQLQSWVAAGWLVDSGAEFQARASWQRGVLELNGRPLGLPF